MGWDGWDLVFDNIESIPNDMCMYAVMINKNKIDDGISINFKFKKYTYRLNTAQFAAGQQC